MVVVYSCVMSQMWWVNQSSRGGPAINQIVWAPAASKSRRSIPRHWQVMADVEAGDTIFHYTAQHVVGVSIATGPGYPASKPYTERVDEDWVDEGIQIPLDYTALDEPVAKKRIPFEVRLRAVTPYGPFNRKGNVHLGYLFPVGRELYDALEELTGMDRTGVFGKLPHGGGLSGDPETPELSS